MMNKPKLINYLILPIYFILIFLFCSVNSWFTLWMILELNTISFVVMISYLNMNSDCMFKYFLVQMISSMMLMFSSIFFINLIYLNLNNFMLIILNFSLLIKLGMVPFHIWYFNLVKKFNWLIFFFFSVIQKFLPLIILSYCFDYYTLMWVSTLSMLMVFLYIWVEEDLRMVLGYSSLNHLSWILFMMILDSEMWLIYYFFYIFMNINILLFLNYMNIFYMNQMYYMKKWMKNFFIISMFSLMGFPFSLGFLIKFKYINIILENNIFILLSFMFIVSTLMFLMYMRVMLNLILDYLVLTKQILILKNLFVINKFWLIMMNFLMFFSMPYYFYI
nr:NADH deshydrogenase subunit 2 [Euceros kiushuensis]